MGAGLACCPSESWGTLMPKPSGSQSGATQGSPGAGCRKSNARDLGERTQNLWASGGGDQGTTVAGG